MEQVRNAQERQQDDGDCLRPKVGTRGLLRNNLDHPAVRDVLYPQEACKGGSFNHHPTRKSRRQEAGEGKGKAERRATREKNLLWEPRNRSESDQT